MASHFALSTPSLTLSRIPFWGRRLGLGRIGGLGRPRFGGGCRGKGLLGEDSGEAGMPGGAMFGTCRDSAGAMGRCCLPINLIKGTNSLKILFCVFPPVEMYSYMHLFVPWDKDGPFG